MLLGWLLFAVLAGAGPDRWNAEAWQVAREARDVHRFSTLFTAHDVRDYLGTDQGIAAAIAWCRKNGISKVYLETYRNRYQAESAVLQLARDRFRAAGLEVSGCVTTTRVGRPSTGLKDLISCYTDSATQARLQRIFEHAAGLFDEVMINDSWFTDCACAGCDAARKARTVTVGEKVYPAPGDTWADYRKELMGRLSRDRLQQPARRVNPKVRLVLKYPQWYDRFHERGYDVLRGTADFDRIWAGTEIRDSGGKGGAVQYEAYFFMRWLRALGRGKCGGGWFDSLGATERNYVEQARQNILAGAAESMLFRYGSLQKGNGPKNIAFFRTYIPELVDVARQVRTHHPWGIAAFQPPGLPPAGEARVFDFLGMTGLPLEPCYEFPVYARAAFFSVHALGDPDLVSKLTAFVKQGRRALITDGLARSISEHVDLTAANVRILSLEGRPESLLELPQPELDSLRAWVLKPLKVSFLAPNRVALYLFSKNSWVVENFNDHPVTVEIKGKSLNLIPRGWAYRWK